VGSPWCSDRVGTREGTHRRPAATAHAVRTAFVPESQAACRCTDRQGLHADKRSQNAVHCCLWRWRSEREMGACSLRLNRLARIFGKFLASGFFDEGTASEKSENRRINTGDLWWAWVDLNHRPRPYQGNAVRFYNNIQDRRDCQTPRKSYTTSHFVGWIVGWKFARSSEQVASANATRGQAFSRWPIAGQCGRAFGPPRVERRELAGSPQRTKDEGMALLV